jgi:sigma-E factor negative regulatory protein RseC
MIEEYAIVTAVRDNHASLVLERRTACGICGQKRGCGNATWSKMVKSQPHEFTAHNAIHAQVGDAVVVGMDENAVLRSVGFLYVAPLLSLLLGALLADYLFTNQFYVMLGAAIGLLSGFYAARYFAMSNSANHQLKQGLYQAHILRQAEDGPLEHCGSAPN